jgi:hypothetical protein
VIIRQIVVRGGVMLDQDDELGEIAIAAVL